MRIISKFQDYYDSSLAYGQDENLVFVRSMVECDDEFIKSCPIDVPCHEPLSNKENNKHHLSFSHMAIAFCGKVYYGVQVVDMKDPDYYSHKYTPRYFYSLETLKRYLIECGFEVERVSKYKGVKRRIPIFDIHLTHFFNQSQREHYDYLVSNKITIMAISKFNAECRYKPYSFNGDFKVYINPRLKDFQFYTILDPFKTYQEIAMWIGGVLPHDGAPMVTIDDKYKIAEHGFDKWSFRKLPEVKQ